jgi:hypothetical protein
VDKVKLIGNELFFGNNLDILRKFPDASVDLVYLDPRIKVS